MDIKTRDDILHGRLLLKSLPPIKTRIFRIYLCAPFSDTIEEQNELVENVLPKVREFSMYRYGIEFQMVNLTWGIKCDKINYKTLIDNCFTEIDKCQELSIGPVFLALLGNECGRPVLPLSISRTHFDVLMNVLNEGKLDSSLVKKYYIINKNYLENQYELVDKSLNIETELKLIDILKTARNLAIKRNLLKEGFLSTLDETLLERFLNYGAFSIDDKINKIFTYVGIQDNINVNDRFEFIREKLVNYHIPPEQIYRIRKSHNSNYIKNFGDNYLKLFKKLVEKFVQKNPELEHSSSYEDALRHFHYIKDNTLNEMIVGSERSIKYLRDYIFDENYTKPIILYGPMGSGKTTSLATFASTLHLQLKANNNYPSGSHVILVRFIGADRKSMDLRSLLTSMCLQLNEIYNKNGNEIPKKLKDLKTFFRSFLEDKNSNEKLVILIDSLQDLSPNDNAYKLDWLPYNLRVNCKVILTTSIENKDLLERLKNKYTDSKSYVCLEYLSPHQSNYIVKKFLDINKRRLEDNQFEIVRDLIMNANMLSLHLKLLSNEFLNWKSYTHSDECILKVTATEAIDHYFSNLEKIHGKQLVKSILSYITLSRTGLSECELQDVLSLDNQLLKAILPELNQPKQILQCPWFLILRLLQDIQKHIVIRPDNGIYVIFWRHKLFGEIVRKKYLSSSEDYLTQCHLNIAEYYMGSWASPLCKQLEFEEWREVVKPPTQFESFSGNNKVIHKVKYQANRLVPRQPIVHESFHTNIKPRYNLRKLAMLPYHLVKAEMTKSMLNNSKKNLAIKRLGPYMNDPYFKG